MAPWLALTTDGMLLAALVVIWVRRHRGEHVKAGPWATFWAGMTATIAAIIAAAQPTPIGIVVVLWPPACLAITLELVALAAYPAKPHPAVDDVRRGERTGHEPAHALPAPGHVHTETSGGDRAPQLWEFPQNPGHENKHLAGEAPAEPTAETGHAPTAGLAGTKQHAASASTMRPAPAPIRCVAASSTATTSAASRASTYALSGAIDIAGALHHHARDTRRPLTTYNII